MKYDKSKAKTLYSITVKPVLTEYKRLINNLSGQRVSSIQTKIDSF